VTLKSKISAVGCRKHRLLDLRCCRPDLAGITAEELTQWMQANSREVYDLWHVSAAYSPTSKLERINLVAKWLTERHPELAGSYILVRDYLIHDLAGYGWY